VFEGVERAAATESILARFLFCAAVEKENEGDRKSGVSDFSTDFFVPVFIVGVSGGGGR
jgi:hypothetical protein